MKHKLTQDERITPVLAQLIELHPEFINWEYAEAVNKEMGLSVTNKDISRIRNKIGLGFYDLSQKQMLESLKKALAGTGKHQGDLEELRSLIQKGETFGMRATKPGSYCFERKNKSGDATTVSATFLSDEPDKFELNIICKKRGDALSATFGLKMIRGDRWVELYRIDYEEGKGWHLDSELYRLKHEPVPQVRTWHDALELILRCPHPDSLPFHLGMVNSFFLDPEHPIPLS
jgi:hypothetical protein